MCRLSWLALGLLMLAGCGPKLNVEKTYTLASGDIKALILDPTKRQNVVKIDVTAQNPIHVFVVLKENEDKVTQQ